MQTKVTDPHYENYKLKLLNKVDESIKIPTLSAMETPNLDHLGNMSGSNNYHIGLQYRILNSTAVYMAH